MKKLDRNALAVLFICILMLIILIFVQRTTPVKIVCTNQPDCAFISPYGNLTFEFSTPVDAEKIEDAFRITPLMEGKWLWEDDQHARWIGNEPISQDRIFQFQFFPGVVGQRGEKITQTFLWETRVRQAEIVYLSEQEPREIFKINPFLEAPAPQQLTYTAGKIYDFSPSPDGEMIVFSVINDQFGIDLWVMNRDGGAQSMFLNCGKDRCTTPVWSRYRTEILYTREQAIGTYENLYGTPRPWIINLTTNQTQRIFQDNEKIGYGPQFSPDEKWISIWNGVRGGIEIVNRDNGNILLFESTGGSTGSWSVDSKFLFYDHIIQGESSFHQVIYKVNLNTLETNLITNPELQQEGVAFKNPVISPNGSGLAVSMVPNNISPGNEIWFLDSNGEKRYEIEDNPATISSFYTWDPYGENLLYKSFDLQDQTNSGSLIVWNLNDYQNSRVIVQNANFPAWLP